jgi:hypothetical protein
MATTMAASQPAGSSGAALEPISIDDLIRADRY